MSNLPKTDRAIDVEDMVNSPGYEYILEYIREEISNATKSLLTCDVDKIMVYRGKVKALENLLYQIEKITNEREGE